MKIPAYNYIHPEDKAALENLKNIPMFTTSLKAFMKFLPEQYLHGMNMAQKVRLGPNQLPHMLIARRERWHLQKSDDFSPLCRPMAG
jgi:hypothetical protein